MVLDVQVGVHTTYSKAGASGVIRGQKERGLGLGTNTNLCDPCIDPWSYAWYHLFLYFDKKFEYFLCEKYHVCHISCWLENIPSLDASRFGFTKHSRSTGSCMSYVALQSQNHSQKS